MADDFLEQIQEVKTQLSQFRKFLNSQSFNEPDSTRSETIGTNSNFFINNLNEKSETPSQKFLKKKEDDFFRKKTTQILNEPEKRFDHRAGPEIYSSSKSERKSRYKHISYSEKEKEASSPKKINDFSPSSRKKRISSSDDDFEKAIVKTRKSSGASSPFDKYHFKNFDFNDIDISPKFINNNRNDTSSSSSDESPRVKSKSSLRNQSSLRNKSKTSPINKNKSSPRIQDESSSEKTEISSSGIDFSDELLLNKKTKTKKSPKLFLERSKDKKKKDVVEAVKLIDKYLDSSPSKKLNKVKNKYYSSRVNLQISQSFAVPFSGSYDGVILNLENEKDIPDNETGTSLTESDSLSEQFASPVPDVFEPKYIPSDSEDTAKQKNNDSLEQDSSSYPPKNEPASKKYSIDLADIPDVEKPKISMSSSDSSDIENVVKNILDFDSESTDYSSIIKSKPKPIKREKNKKNSSNHSDSDTLPITHANDLMLDNDSDSNLGDLMTNLLNNMKEFEKSAQQPIEIKRRRKMQSNKDDELTQNNETATNLPTEIKDESQHSSTNNENNDP